MTATAFDRLLSVIETKAFRPLVENWLAVRGDRPMPCRGELDPTVFPSALSRMWVYEQEPDGEFVCRLAGEDINEAFQSRPVGRTADDLLGEQYRRWIRERWLYCLKRPAILYARSCPPVGAGKRANRLTLPLADRDGVPRAVVGATDYLHDRHRHRDQPILAGEELYLFDARSFLPVEAPFAPAQGLP